MENADSKMIERMEGQIYAYERGTERGKVTHLISLRDGISICGGVDSAFRNLPGKKPGQKLCKTCNKLLNNYTTYVRV